MAGPKIVGLLDEAAQRIGAAIGIDVQRRAMGLPDLEETPQGVTLVAALSEAGAPVETGFRMGGADPFDMEARARFEIMGLGGEDADRIAMIDAAYDKAEAAILADPTLGGRCDYAELQASAPDEIDDAFGVAGSAAWGCDLVILYAARTARG